MRKGFTLVELLGVIILLGLVGLIVIPSITKLIRDSRQDLYINQVKMVEESARKWGIQNTHLLSETNSTYLSLTDLINDGLIEQDVVKDPRSSSDMNGCVVINYDNQKNKYKYIYHDETCADIINEGAIYTDFVTSEGVNKPRLADGMTAIKWNGTSWDTISDPETDTTWYDYSNKEWANAQTEDGSFWVWIPRYAYQISSSYHSDVVGTINVKFLIDNRDQAHDATAIAETATYDGSSQTNYIQHPAFTFGTTELTGIWVAKFEMSPPTNHICYTTEFDQYDECDVSTIAPKSVPNVESWRYANIGNMFTAARNMETNSLYGWDISGSGIDTHMMKNNEWGAVTYLFKSTYGKIDEVWMNPSEDYITGCSGGSLISPYATGCSNTYDTSNGQQASTTGNVYGIYDMSGGASEYVMGNYNNTIADSYLAPSSIDAKYKNIYASYYSAESIKGDAIYETSNTTEDYTALSWFGDYSNMVQVDYPWIARGGNSYDGSGGCGGGLAAGLFAFDHYYGSGSNYTSFRSVIAVDTGL